MPEYRFTHDAAVVFADEHDEAGGTLRLEPGETFTTDHEITHPYLTEVKAKPAKVTTEKEDQDRG